MYALQNNSISFIVINRKVNTKDTELISDFKVGTSMNWVTTLEQEDGSMGAWEHGSMGAWGGEHGSTGAWGGEHGSTGRGAWEQNGR